MIAPGAYMLARMARVARIALGADGWRWARV
jgi:hypothetical protein